jgi:hypothetical protein
MIVHVLPLHDVIEHDVPGGIDGKSDAHPFGWLVIEQADDPGDIDRCACGPLVELQQADNGDHWQVIHHSLDGREFQERPGKLRRARAWMSWRIRTWRKRWVTQTRT